MPVNISLGSSCCLCRALRAALPHAPHAQAISEPTILHTTLARLLRPPTVTASWQAAHRAQTIAPGGIVNLPAAQLLETAMDAMTQHLCGLQATMRELWCAQSTSNAFAKCF